MTSTVRFYDANVVDPADFYYYNDGSTADGTAHKGRFVLTVDPFVAPSGTDGQFFELDFVVDDPDDATMVFWGWVGVNVATSPAMVTAGFIFDAAAPTAFDYWGCFRDTKTDYDTYVAGNLVAGATGYARNNAIFFDGTYTIQGLGFVIDVDGASIADWWHGPPPPDAPTITAPAAGPISYGTDTVTATLTWNAVTGADSYEVRDNGGTPISEAGLSHPFTYAWASALTHTLEVRSVNTFGTSAWSSVVISLEPVHDTPLDCVDDEALLDSPSVLYLFREAAGPGTGVADLSGNGHDLAYRYSDDSEGVHWKSISGADHALDVIFGVGEPTYGPGSTVVFWITLGAGSPHPPTLSTYTLVPSDCTLIAEETYADNSRVSVFTAVATSNYHTWHFEFSAIVTVSCMARALRPFETVAEVDIVNDSGNITLPSNEGEWGRVIAFGGISSEYADIFETFGAAKITEGAWTEPNAGAVLSGKVKGNAVVQIVHADDPPLFTPGRTSDGICDSGCADVNYSLGMAQWGNQGDDDGHGTDAIGYLMTVDNFDPFDTDGWCVALVKLAHYEGSLSFGYTTIEIFDIGRVGNDGTQWRSYPGAVPVAGGDSCWRILAFEGGTLSRTRLLDALSYPDDRDRIFADIAFFAVYPGVLPLRRQEALLSHFCHLCRRGAMPPVRISQRTDQPGRIGQIRTRQKAHRILGSGTIY